MSDKRMSAAEVVGELRDGMTIGIGGWGSRRKPMALVREILRSDLRDLTIVSYGGPDVGLLCATGKVKRVIYGFVSLDSIPLEPHFRKARESGSVEVTELDEGMLQWGLRAAAMRIGFLPVRVGPGSDLMKVNDFKTVRDPYGDEELVAMPALKLDVALVHANRADARGNAMYLGPDWFFDDWFCMAADRAFVSCERVVDTADLTKEGDVRNIQISRMWTSGVVETPYGAHFTHCVPDYERDERFQKEYAATAKDDDAWAQFKARYLDVTEDEYLRAVGVQA